MKKKYLSLIICILIFLTGICSLSIAEGPEEIKKIVIGDDINYPPYSYLDEDGNPAGFNIDLAIAVGNAMGYEVEIKLDEWNVIREALDRGEIDAIAGMFYSNERLEYVNFTSRHSITNGDIFTLSDVEVQSIDALKNERVVVQKGDITGEYLKSLDLNIQFVEVPTVKEALMVLKDGTAKYAGLSKLPGIYTMKSENISNITYQNLNLQPTDYCMAVQKDNEALLLTLNGGLQVVKATGQYSEIYDKWLGIYEETTFKSLVYKFRYLILGTVIVILGLILITAILKKIVNIKTRELKDANFKLYEDQKELESLNLELEANVEELTAMEEELREQYDILLSNEKKLRESEERNRSIVNALPDLVFTFDENYTFIDCQISKYEELFIPIDAFIGKKLTELFSPELANLGIQKIKAAFQSGELQTFEYTLPINGEEEVYEMRLVKSKESEVIGITRNISAERLYLDQIEYLSYHDQLTGLYNRRYFEEEVQRLDVPRNYPLGIIMADVNGLKLINDSFGHKVGDELLIKVAQVLRKGCRSDEIISRIGGDEFVILIPDITSSHVERLVDRIRSIAKSEQIQSVELSISFGWDIKHSTEDSVQDIFKRAENLMYKQKLFEGPSMRGKTIGAIIHTLNEKNKREEEHSQRVSELSKHLAQHLGFSEHAIEEIKSAGLLHDIGKIAIAEDLLNKPGRLTEDEYNEMKRHPEIGYRILRSVNDMLEISEYVLSHHEHWDGKGYPNGIKGDQIPLQSRIIAIADAFDAITSKRSYRNAKSTEEAINELRRCSGTQFDPKLVDAFIEMLQLQGDKLQNMI